MNSLKIILSIIILTVTNFIFAANYFSKPGTSNPNDLNNWTTNSAGTGTVLTSFTGTNHSFIVQSGHNMTTTADWSIQQDIYINGTLTINHTFNSTRYITVRGNLIGNADITGGRLRVDAGGLASFSTGNINSTTVTGSGDITFTGDVTWTISSNNTNTGTFTPFNPSTVIYSSTNNRTIKAATYHHLIINTSSATNSRSLTGNTTVQGNLTITQGILDCKEYQITSTPTSQLSIANTGQITLGDITSTNNITLPTNISIANTSLAAGSRVTYNSNAPQIIPTGYNFSDLYISGGNVTKDLGAISVGKDLYIKSNVTVNTTGDISIGGNLITQNNAIVNLNTFTNTIAGNLVVENSSIVNKTSGTLSVTGVLTNEGTVSLGGAITTVMNHINNNGTLTVNTGTLNVTRNLQGTGNSSITGAGSFILSQSFTQTGPFTAATGSTVTYNSPGTTTRTVKGGTYHHLTINQGGTSDASMNGNVIVNGNLAINSGELVSNEFSITGNPTGTFSIANGKRLTLGSTSSSNDVGFPTGFTAANTTLGTNTRVTFRANTAQTIPDHITYGDLHISSGTINTKTTGGNLSINGDLYVTSPAIFELGNNIHTINGNIVSTSTINLNNSTTTISGNFTSTGATNINTGTLSIQNNFTTTGNVNLSAGTINVANDFEINSPATLAGTTGTLDIEGHLEGSGDVIFNGAGMLFIGENFSNTGTYTQGTSLITFDGTSNSILKNTTYTSLIINKPTNRVAEVLHSLTVTGDVDIINGSLRINSANKTVHVNGTTTVQSGGQIYTNTPTATFNLQQLNMTGGKVGGNANGTITSTGLSATGIGNILGEGKITINGTTNISGELAFDHPIGKKTFNGDVFITNTGKLLNPTHNINVEMTENLTVDGSINATNGQFEFSGIGKSISGTTASLILDQSNFSGTYTNNVVNTLTILGDLSGSGSLTNAANSTLSIGGEPSITTLVANTNPNTVIYGNIDPVAKFYNTTYHNLVINKNNTSDLVSVPDGTTNVNGDLDIIEGQLRFDSLSILNVTGTTTIHTNGGLSSDSSSADIHFPDINLNEIVLDNGGDLGGGFDYAVVSGTSLTIKGTTNQIRNTQLTITGVTNSPGDVTFTTSAGDSNVYIGTVTVDGTWTFNRNKRTYMHDDLVINGTYKGEEANHWFLGSAKEITGTATKVSFNDATFNGTYTNNVDTLELTDDLRGSGSLTNAAGNFIEIFDDATITTLIATANPNTVIYNGDGDQEGKETTYHNLTIDNSNPTAEINMHSNVHVVNLTHVKRGILDFEGNSTRATGLTLTVDSAGTFEVGTSTSQTPFVPEHTGIITFNDYSTASFAGSSNVGIKSGLPFYHVRAKGGGGNKSLLGNIDINGNLSIEDNARFDVSASNHTVNLAGNWISSTTNGTASLVKQQGEVILDGSSTQSISCGGRHTETFYDLTINNGGNLVVINDSITIEKDLKFTSASTFDITGAKITIEDWNSGAAISNYSTNRVYFINDKDSRLQLDGVKDGETAIFKLGFSSNYMDMSRIDATNNAGATHSFESYSYNFINREGTTTGTNTITEETVNITYNINSASDNADLKLYWDESNEPASFDRTLSWTAHGPGVGPRLNWTPLTLPQSSINHTGTVHYSTSTTNAFSPFGVGSGGSPLPIELLDFTVVLNNSITDISWVTASEKNNDYFTIERSKDLDNWSEISTINGAGNSNIALKYKSIDEEPLDGISYYRLKQTDYDGGFTYSQTRVIETNQLNDIILFPLPANDLLTIVAHKSSIKAIEFINNTGQSFLSIDSPTESNGDYKIDISILPVGYYTSLITTEQGIIVRKVAVQ